MLFEAFFALVALRLQACRQRLGLALEERLQRVKTPPHGVFDLRGLASQSLLQTGETGFIVLDLRTEEDLADFFDAGTAGFGRLGNRRIDGIRRLVAGLSLSFSRTGTGLMLRFLRTLVMAGATCYTQMARLRTTVF